MNRNTAQSTISVSETPAPARYAGRDGHARMAAAVIAVITLAAEKKTP
jgi:hypothetical protein